MAYVYWEDRSSNAHVTFLCRFFRPEMSASKDLTTWLLAAAAAVSGGALVWLAHQARSTAPPAAVAASDAKEKEQALAEFEARPYVPHASYSPASFPVSPLSLFFLAFSPLLPCCLRLILHCIVGSTRVQ